MLLFHQGPFIARIPDEKCSQNMHPSSPPHVINIKDIIRHETVHCALLSPINCSLSRRDGCEQRHQNTKLAFSSSIRNGQEWIWKDEKLPYISPRIKPWYQMRESVDRFQVIFRIRVTSQRERSRSSSDGYHSTPRDVPHLISSTSTTSSRCFRAVRRE